MYDESHLKDTSLTYLRNSKTFEKIPKISMVLPCYNEEKTIGKVLDAIQSLEFPNYEIVVVDDCSSDCSVEIIEKYKNTKIIKHKVTKGYGGALLDGIKSTEGDIIITLDSDGQHDPKDIPVLIKPVIDGKVDIVVGSRYCGRYNYTIPLINRTGEAILETVLRVVFGIRIRNNQGGFRVFHRRTLDIFSETIFMDMAFTTEILMIGAIKGYRIEEGPINLSGRTVGVSRVKRIKLLRDLVKSLIFYGFKNILFKISSKNPRLREYIKKVYTSDFL